MKAQKENRLGRMGVGALWGGGDTLILHGLLRVLFPALSMDTRLSTTLVFLSIGVILVCIGVGIQYKYAPFSEGWPNKRDKNKSQ